MLTPRRFEITDEQRIRIEHLLSGRPESPGATAKDNLLVVAAVLWMARTDAPWRDLPERFGDWNSTFQRFNRWARSGRWAKLREALGRSRGGMSTKVHVAVDALGNPVQLIVTASQAKGRTCDRR